LAILLVLMPARTKPCLRSDALSALARLGVTSVALVRDERSLGVVVEGWAFDPIESAEAVIAAVSGRSRRARTLQPVMEMTLSQGDR
jgi:hypothetical protein